MKFLRTIRFDESDDNVFVQPAMADEWAVPGGFAFANKDPFSLSGKSRQAFTNGFLGLGTFGRSTFACVGDISDPELTSVTNVLARHFVDFYGAPDVTAAMPAAQEEVGFVIDLCAEVLINTVFTLRRTCGDNGEIREEFRQIRPPDVMPSHAPVWSITDDDA